MSKTFNWCSMCESKIEVENGLCETCLVEWKFERRKLTGCLIYLVGYLIILAILIAVLWRD